MFGLQLSGCSQDDPWNRPYTQSQAQSNTLFSSFATPPKHLDPVRSYSANEWAIISQVYEPPLQYQYLKRPYTLEPLTLTQMPEQRFLDERQQPVDADSDQVRYTEYHFYLRDDIRYQPHPAFARDKDGQFLYHNLTPAQLDGLERPGDLAQSGTRRLVAQDYALAIKRMAYKPNHSPILGNMRHLIVGLADYSDRVSQQRLDLTALRDTPIEGVHVHSDTHFSIRIHGRYPQFLYWLSMNFFAPIPWEALAFYQQPGLVKKNLTLDTYPVGTGPYRLVENNPNRQMHLQRNPHYQHGTYPSEGLPEGADPALLADAGRALPLIDDVIYSLEKESVPLWNKFLQGYYDASGVSSDSFDQAISVSSQGELNLTPEMQEKGIAFLSAVQPTVFYLGFNMADPVVGGYDQSARQLRQAISIAVDMEEYISIFLNGRGVAAQGPIPPGIYGYERSREHYNDVVYRWQKQGPVRRSLDEARALLSKAGYPNGQTPEGEPLTLYYDTPATGPDAKSQLNWYRKQLAKLGIELVIRATDYNRFQEKVRGAKVQLFSWGWNADYPDPENFLFLLSGNQAVINTNGSGVNASNYDRPQFNQWFDQVKRLPNGPKRKALIRKMVRLVQHDAPWVWGLHPKSLSLFHNWYHNVWPNPMANNTLKYRRLDPETRVANQQAWNRPVVWPLWLLGALILVSIYPLMAAYRKRQQQTLTQPAISQKSTSDQGKQTREDV
ncbi:peptide ABC transporter substrate-binding protein [Thiomicrospira sp. WB1]|nr:peptide ABC transporter substrate-binding protein [Thiomicrospira sp. WB1]